MKHKQTPEPNQKPLDRQTALFIDQFLDKENFFNTINEKTPQLIKLKQNAQNQQNAILEVFQKYPKTPLSPPKILQLTNLNCPITSIRRAISNLTKQGKLSKTQIQEIGPYGVKNYLWILNCS